MEKNASIKPQQIEKIDKIIIREEEPIENDEKINIQTVNLKKKYMIDYVNFGKVYKVTDKKNNLNHAGKVIHGYQSPLAKKILNGELKILLKLSHPLISKFIGYGPIYYNNALMSLTEFNSNNSLEKMIELKRKGKLNGIFTNKYYLNMSYRIAKEMKYLHACGVLHRDLKPGNILIDDSIYPHLIDFGLSIRINDKMEEYPVGTAPYMAPEIWSRLEYSKKSDVYAYGILIHELLSVDNRFNNNSNGNRIYFNNSISESNIDKSIPEAFKELIKRCLDIDPDKRPSFDQILEKLRTNHDFITEKTNEDTFCSHMELKNEKEKGNDTTLIENKIISKEKRDIYQSIVQQDKIDEDKKFNIHLKSLKVKKIDLNQFIEKGLIKSGGFADVFLIMHKETGKLCAAKKMDQKHRSVFIKELKILSKTNHPLIVKLFGYSLEDFQQVPCLIIVLEYMKNGSIENIISDDKNFMKKDQWNDTMKLINIYGIASVMKYLHSLNFLHCDLTPSNILLNDLGLPTVCDFGISLLLKLAQTIHNDLRGTAAFCSPELFKQGIYSKKSDVYSFAMVIYEIITNMHPFEKLNPYQVNFEINIKKSRPKINNTVPNRYKELITKCWDENPDNRPSFEQIEHELRTDDSFITDKTNKDIYHLFIEILDEREQGYDITDKLYKNFPKFDL